MKICDLNDDFWREDISQIIPPTQVVLVSTCSSSGIANLAPISCFMIASYDPPGLAFSSLNTSDTARNVIDNAELVIGIPTIQILPNVLKCGDSIPFEKDEFEYAHLTKQKSRSVLPYSIDECCINIECMLKDYLSCGDHKLFYGIVKAVSINSRLLASIPEEFDYFRVYIEKIAHVNDGVFLSGFERMIYL